MEEDTSRPVSLLRWVPLNNIDVDPTLLEELADAIHKFTTRGADPCWSRSQHQPLVEYGVARFIPQGTSIKVEEPLALLGITRFFETNYRDLGSSISRRFDDNKGTAFEEIVLLVMTSLLQNQRNLSDIVMFHNDPPPWAHRTAQIVARNASGVFEPFSLERPMDLASRYAFSADGPKDVKQWLENGVSGWCLPGRYMGPDLLARLKFSNGESLLLLIQAKCHSSSNIDTIRADVTAAAIRSLIPDNFFWENGT